MNHRERLPRDIWTSLRATIGAALAVSIAGALAMLMLLTPNGARASDALQILSLGLGLFFLSAFVLCFIMGPGVDAAELLVRKMK